MPHGAIERADATHLRTTEPPGCTGTAASADFHLLLAPFLEARRRRARAAPVGFHPFRAPFLDVHPEGMPLVREGTAHGHPEGMPLMREGTAHGALARADTTHLQARRRLAHAAPVGFHPFWALFLSGRSNAPIERE